MSDGHFNKCFLPHNQFQSGLRAGKALGRMKALDVFRRFLDKSMPELDAVTQESYITAFKEELEKELAANSLERSKQ